MIQGIWNGSKTNAPETIEKNIMGLAIWSNKMGPKDAPFRVKVSELQFDCSWLCKVQLITLRSLIRASPQPSNRLNAAAPSVATLLS